MKKHARFAQKNFQKEGLKFMKGKKLLAGVLSAAMVLGTMAFPVFADETGIETVNEPETSEQPTTELKPDYSWYTADAEEYKISDVADLIGFSDISNGKVDFDEDGKGDPVNFAGKTVSLESDIDMSDVKNWLSIGAKSRFQGTFNGNDHTISNFTSVTNGFLLSGEAWYGNGFFGNLGGATIKDVTFDNADVKCVQPYNYGNVYGIVSAYSYGEVTFENVHVSNSSVYGYGKIGGILGMAADPDHGKTIVKNCSVENTEINACYNAGGMIGNVQGKIVMSGNTVENITFNKADGNDYKELNTEITCTEENKYCEGAGTKVDGTYWVYNGYYWGGFADFYVRYGHSSHDCTVKGEDFGLANGEIVHNATAQIGDKKYLTLADAVVNAAKGDTVQLLCDTIGTGVKVESGKDITIDFGGHEYIMNNPLVGSSKDYETNGFQLLQNSKIVMKNGTLYSDVANILIQNYANLTLEDMNLSLNRVHENPKQPLYTLSNNNGHVILTGNTNISALDRNFAFDVCRYSNYPGVSVTLDENMTGTINGRIELSGTKKADNDFELIIKNGNVNGQIVNSAPTANIQISGGTFSTNVNKYVADGYIAVENDGKYTVKKSDIQVEDTAQAVSTTIALNGLEENLKTNHSALFKDGEQAIYKTVVDVPSADDQTKAASVEKAENAKREMYDIKVVKFVGGVAVDKIPVTNQEVTLTLGTPVNPGERVKVTHIDGNGVAQEISDVKADGNKVTFTAPSFSTYVVDVVPAAVTDIAENIDVKFENMVVDGKTATFDLVIEGAYDKTINRFSSSEWTFKVTDGFAYSIEPAPFVNITVPADEVNGVYGLNMNGKTYSDATGKKIKLAAVTVTGDGKFEFNAASAKLHAAKIADNIVTDFDSAATAENGKVNIPTEPAKAELTTKKYDLTVNIAFNNAVDNNEKAYQDMTVTVSGGDLTDALTYELGSDNTDVAYNGGYNFTVSGKLSENNTYTVKVEGAGYRTARYTVTMTGNKTLNFWNNVKDNKMQVEEGVGEAKATTFLAGDIVKDGTINIYDLSAVVSYFGTDNLVAEHHEYAKYDLNRDGKIDSKDVAYVLVSWGK